MKLFDLILQAGPALIQFLASDNFGPLDPDHPDVSLIESLPLARSGLIYRVGLKTLIDLYTRVHSLQFPAGVIYPDPTMDLCFGGQVPAEYMYHQKRLIPMGDAIDCKLVDHPLNTFDVMEKDYPSFDRRMCTYKIISDIIKLNTTTFHTKDDVLRDSLLKEYNIIVNAYNVWIRIMSIGTKEQKETLKYYQPSIDVKEPEYY